MLWWAYAGLSGSITFSLALSATLLGMPMAGVGRLTLETLVTFLLAGLIVHLCAGALSRTTNPDVPKRKPALGPLESLLAPTSAHASAQPRASAQPPAKRSLLAELRPDPIEQQV